MLSFSLLQVNSNLLKVSINENVLLQIMQALADKISRSISQLKHYEVDNEVRHIADRWSLIFHIQRDGKKVTGSEITIKFDANGNIPVSRPGSLGKLQTTVETDTFGLDEEFYTTKIVEFLPSIVRSFNDTLFNVNI